MACRPCFCVAGPAAHGALWCVGLGVGLLAGMPWVQPPAALGGPVQWTCPPLCRSELRQPYQQDFGSARPVRGRTLMGLQSGLRMDGLRRMLGRFGLSGHHHLQPIQKLSGAAAHHRPAFIEHQRSIVPTNRHTCVTDWCHEPTELCHLLALTALTPSWQVPSFHASNMDNSTVAFEVCSRVVSHCRRPEGAGRVHGHLPQQAAHPAAG